MKRTFFIVLALLGVGMCYAQDCARLSERSIMGTARYVGMGGAMSAIGGDPSAVRDNPAGLGMYRRSEVLLTLDYAYDRTRQFGAQTPQTRHIVMLPHVSWVLSLPTAASLTDEGVLAHNFMLSYHRMNSYARLADGTATDVASLGAVIAGTGTATTIDYCSDRQAAANVLHLKESGYTNEYALDWSMNISNKGYLGVGLRVQSYLLSSEGDYYEQFEQVNAEGVPYANRDQTSLILSGVSFSGIIGAIYRPASWLRLGFSLQTPSLGSVTTSTFGMFTAQTDSLRAANVPRNSFTASDFHMPLHTSTSLAFQIGYYGLIAFQYDYYHQKGEQDIHSLRAGLEVIPIPGMYINAGYAYESTFRKNYQPAGIDTSLDRMDAYSLRTRRSQYASIALGYRGKYAIAQVAYQFRWQGLNLYAHEAAEPYDIRTDTHRVVVTIGWHRY